MAEEMQETSKKVAPNTRDIITVKRADKSKAVITPQGDYNSSSGGRPTRSEPVYAKRRTRKGNRTLVLTP